MDYVNTFLLTGKYNTPGSTDGQETDALLSGPDSVVSVPSEHSVYVISSGWRVRKVNSSFYVSTIAGTATSGNKLGPGATAQFTSIYGMTYQAATHSLYVADFGMRTTRLFAQYPIAFVASCYSFSPSVGNNCVKRIDLSNADYYVSQVRSMLGSCDFDLFRHCICSSLDSAVQADCRSMALPPLHACGLRISSTVCSFFLFSFSVLPHFSI